jgi:tetratricopeptide (TPR) repeat protein
MIKSIKLQTFASRIFLIFAGFACLTLFFFFAKWCFANALASKADTKEIAELTTQLAPSDPQTHYSLAVLSEKTFLPEDLPKSLAEYEQAAALSPDDYRFWFALGKARERNGDAPGAESALRKSLEFAPNYAQVQWALGNVLLRQGKIDEAFVEIRRAAEGDAKLANPTVSSAWQIFDGDLAQVKQNIGDSAQTNSALATFLAKQKRFDEAIEIWNALPAEEKKIGLKQSGEEFFREMLAAKRFRDALQIKTEIGETENFAPGKLSNGGFETEVKTKDASVFEWQIADGLQPQIGFDDAQKRGGNRSLVVVFNSATGKDFRWISQTVAVESGKSYRFEMFYKADLKTAATLKWEIVDASSDKILATTNSTLANSDWTNLQVEFTASETTQAVMVRLVREVCKSGICPIAGKIWFDDFLVIQQ